MGQVSISGSQILSGPVTGTQPGAVPIATDTIPLSLSRDPKGWIVQCGPTSRTLSSAYGTYTTMTGIGSTDAVTQATFLYVRTSAPMQLRFTQANLAGGSPIVSVVQSNGCFIHEFPDSGYLTLLEASGPGTIEYFASGNI